MRHGTPCSNPCSEGSVKYRFEGRSVAALLISVALKSCVYGNTSENLRNLDDYPNRRHRVRSLRCERAIGQKGVL